jgi:predicted amidohydrolase
VSGASPFKAACLQVNASNDLAENIRNASDLTRRAVADGAQIVFMPENVAMMERNREAAIAKAMAHEDHTALKAFQALAAELKIWLHAGSIAVLLPGGKLANRTYMLAPDGAIAGQYDKIHMFDVDLGTEKYAESATFEAGHDVVTVDLPWGKLGLTICYDLRFPHLYRQLAQAGVDFLTIPSAFTQPTGEAHWHVLMRARAIETGCYVFAPAQTGVHTGGRKTYGHALIVAPWGEVLADAGTDVGVISAVIDPAKVADARAKIPAWKTNAAF